MKYEKLISISGKKYYLDCDAIMKWCLNSTSNQIKEIELNEGYDVNEDGDMTMVTKIAREVKTNNTQDDTIRYDFIKLLISFLVTDFPNFDNMTEYFSSTVLFNTLIQMNFLIEINED